MTAIANLPDLRSSLLLDFANSGRVDPRVQFSRASSATCFGPDGKLRTVAANVPRIDYDPATGKCLGLLVEEARTNLKPKSRRPDASTGTAIGAATTIAPDGLTIEAIVETATTGEHYVSDHAISNVLVGDVITQSIFVKKTDSTSVREVVLRVAAPNDSGQVRFTIRGDTCTPTTVPTGWTIGYSRCANGWWRVWATWTAAIANTTAVIRIQIHNDAQATYTGDPAQGIFLFGRQLEVGAFPTSYIPTEASAVTRVADASYITPIASPWFSDSSGTVIVSYDYGALNVINMVSLGLDGGSSSNAITLATTSGNTDRFIVTSNGAGAFNSGFSPFTSGVRKTTGLTWGNRRISQSANGGGIASVTDKDLPVGLNRITLGHSGYFSQSRSNGHIAKLAYYPFPVTDAQLQRLTA